MEKITKKTTSTVRVKAISVGWVPYDGVVGGGGVSKVSTSGDEDITYIDE